MSEFPVRAKTCKSCGKDISHMRKGTKYCSNKCRSKHYRTQKSKPAELEGIKVKVNEESYTSKCSFLDKEPVKKHRKYKGKRVKRGLFVSAKGIKINSDINASLNIIRKVAPKAFANGVEGVVVHPCGYFSIK